MSQESDSGGGSSLQDYTARIKLLQGDLDAERKKPRFNRALAQSLERELTELRAEVRSLRAIQAGVGVGSSTQSMCYVAGCVLCLCIVCVEGLRVGLRH